MASPLSCPLLRHRLPLPLRPQCQLLLPHPSLMRRLPPPLLGYYIWAMAMGSVFRFFFLL